MTVASGKYQEQEISERQARGWMIE